MRLLYRKLVKTDCILSLLNSSELWRIRWEILLVATQYVVRSARRFFLIFWTAPAFVSTNFVYSWSADYQLLYGPHGAHLSVHCRVWVLTTPPPTIMTPSYLPGAVKLTRNLKVCCFLFRFVKLTKLLQWAKNKDYQLI